MLMPDCGHYTHYRRVHATIKHFRGFVLTNCMNKFVCAQLEASGRTSSPVCTHAHAHRCSGTGRSVTQRGMRAVRPVLHTWPWGITKKVSERFLKPTSL